MYKSNIIIAQYLIKLSTFFIIMQQPIKTRPLQHKSKLCRTEGSHHASFYEALTHSSSLEYRINQAAQAKLQINPIYKLNIVKRLEKEGDVLHEKRRKVQYFRKKQKTASQDEILCFFKNKDQLISSRKAVKSSSKDMSPTFRQKMKKHLKNYRTNTSQQIQNQPCFTGSAVLLHKRQKHLFQSGRELSSCNRSQFYRVGMPIRQMPVELSNSLNRQRYHREGIYLTERSRDIICPWEGEKQSLPYS